MLSVARGYDPDYLLKDVATGRENYYTGAVADGEPPGRWWGAGAATLGLEGEVDAQDMTALYSRFLDPREDGFSDPGRWDEVYTLGHAGRAYKNAEQLYNEALEREPTADAARRDELRVEASKAERQNLAFLDVTFSVQKSVTLLHTAFEAEEVKARAAGLEQEAAEWAAMREAVEDAIWAGNTAAMTYLQEHAGYARVGHHGGAAGRWIDAHGWVGASFFQHDSREHDPQLHIHNPVLNRQECADGTWRTLDSRAIYQTKPGAAAIGERTTTERLVDRLWTSMAMRPDGLAREATCVTPGMRERFSTRSARLGARARDLVEAFVESQGRDPHAVELDALKREATLATRPAKSHAGQTREQTLARVTAEAAQVVEGGLAGVAHTARAARYGAGAERPAAQRFVPELVIADAIEALQDRKATFSHAELLAEIDRLLPDTLGLPDGRDVTALLSGLADQGMALVEDVEADVAGDELLPDALRLANGRSAYDAPGRRRGVTRGQLHSENRLRAATGERDGVRLAPSQARAFLEQLRAQGVELGADQAAAIRGVLTSGARMETLIGPAGTGKSFVVGTLAQAWRDPDNRPHGEPERRVFGLATAQVAADVLEAEGLTAANCAAWLAAQRRMDSANATGSPVREDDAGWRLRRGDVLVVDESSMADTADLAAIHAYADEAGAKMLLVGDPRQLAAVGAGGVMELVAGAGARYELADARRFTHEWERDASLRLRCGDPGVVQEYHRQGRLLDAGSLADAEASASRAWLADTLAGHRSLLVVDANDQAARVSSSIRDELVRLGRVNEHGVALRDGTYAGVGDVIQGRRLAWELAGYAGNPRGAINREHYRVTGVRSDGALEVEVLPRGAALFETGRRDDAPPPSSDDAAGAAERLVLPPEYVAKDATLAYGVTKHAVEGATVWSSHPVVTPRTDLNGLYVALSRGTETNVGHVATLTGPTDPAQGSEERHSVHRDPRAVIATIVESRETTDQAHRSATAAREDATAWAGSAQTLAERFADAAHEASLERTARHLDELTRAEILGPTDRARIAAEDGTAGLTRLLRQAELAGHDPRQVLHDAIAGRDLDGARRVGDVLHARIRAASTFEPSADTWAQRVPVDIDPQTAAYLAVLGDAADTRVAELGAEAADAPPQWALDLLGPVPDHDTDDSTDAGAARRDWKARAGAIAAHREMRGHPTGDEPRTHTTSATAGAGCGYGDATEVLGSAPARGHVEAHAAYRAAHRAAGLPDYDRDALERSDTWHRACVRGWEREKAWGPVYVDNLLAGTRQDETHARQQAELRRADAETATDDTAREQLTREAGHAEALAGDLARHAATLEEAGQTYAHWYAQTAMTRAHGESSAQVLAERHAADDPEPTVTAEEWLELDRAARREDDAHRDITDTDLDKHPADDHDDRDDGVVTRADQPQRTDRDPAAVAEPSESDQAGPSRGDEADDAGSGHCEQVRSDRDDQDGSAWDDDIPIAETDVPDIRDTSRERPAVPVDEDTVHVPDRGEVASATDRAREAAAELRNRELADQQREERERADQLTLWHHENYAPADVADADNPHDDAAHVSGDTE